MTGPAKSTTIAASTRLQVMRAYRMSLLLCFPLMLMGCSAQKSPAGEGGKVHQFDINTARTALVNWIVQTKDSDLAARLADLSKIPPKDDWRPEELRYTFSDDCLIWMSDRTWWVCIDTEKRYAAYSGEFKRGPDGTWEAVLNVIAGRPFHDPPPFRVPASDSK